MKKALRDMTPQMKLNVLALTCYALAIGFSDSLYSNYFKDAYNVTALQRGLIETPRELPGMLCLFMTAGLSFLGETKNIIIAQILMFAGIIVLGLFTPPLGVMFIFLFINSIGMHMSMPLQDSVGMSLAEPDRVGQRMGQFNSFKTAAQMVAAVVVFIGFRIGFLSFKTRLKVPFLISAVLFAVSTLLYWKLHVATGSKSGIKRKVKFVFKKEYKYFYILAITRALEKQITLVYGPWVLIELLNRGTDTTAVLAIISFGIGIFFLPAIGRGIDKFGAGKMLIVQSVSFICIYTALAFTSIRILGCDGAPSVFLVILACFLYMADKTVYQMGMVRTVYLKSIALDSADVPPTLSTGLSIDHVVTLFAAYFFGLIWDSWGPQYVFFITAGVSCITCITSLLICRQSRHALDTADNS